jgi:O-antigen/teichoic acid export membrane protein
VLNTLRQKPEYFLFFALGLAGISGYLVTFFVYRFVGPSDYTVFAVFWATLYLVVGSLSGIQQEFTRATTSIQSLPETSNFSDVNVGSRVLRLFATISFIAIFLGTLIFWPFFGSVIFAQDESAFQIPLAIGVSFYILVAAFSGLLYGVRSWKTLSSLIAIDGVLRLVFISIGFLSQASISYLVWAIVLPFPVALIILSRPIYRAVHNKFQLDIPLKKLYWNISRTVLAAASLSVIVSGFPVLLSVSADNISSAQLGETILVLTLIRAPIIMVVLALQSALIIRFRYVLEGPGALVRKYLLRLAVVTLLCSLGALFIGEFVFTIILGGKFDLEPVELFIMVCSSGMIAAMCITGPGLLVMDKHRDYSLGWLAAAITSIVLLLLPIDFFVKLNLALLLGPAVGLLTHLVSLSMTKKT